MKILELIKSWNTLIYLGLVAVGLFFGWLLFGGNGNDTVAEILPPGHSEADHKPGTVYTCAMHPQIRADEEGNCPICGMELIPLVDDSAEDDEGADYTVKLSNAAMKIAEVSISKIELKTPYKKVYLPGKVMPDERNISALTARFPGRIEKLTINFTGQKVRKGQVLAKIYSPELVTAQRELFEALKLKDSNPNYYKASRNKLKLWDLTEEQIDEIVGSGEVHFYFDVLSPLTGTVTMRHIALGDYVKEGSPLFEIINLNHVWVMFDAYENDIPWIKLGDKIKFTIKSIPDKEFKSKVIFIDPVLNPMSRVAKVRAELNNTGGLLKPEMLASGHLTSMLSSNKKELLVPKSAILWTGKKAVVYVRTNIHANMFQYRELVLGADAGEFYVVREGLMEGELVASNGVFKIDAAAQLKGEKSMMNPSGGKVSMGMAGMDMGGSKDKATDDKTEKMDMKEGAMNMKMDMGVDSKFKDQLIVVFNDYIVLKDKLVDSDPTNAVAAAKKLRTALSNVDMGLLKDDGMMKWMVDLKSMNTAIGQMINKNKIESQRSAFSPLSDALFASIKEFQIDGINAFYQYCPMANDGDGAFWLSTSDEIRNPYLGEAMLTCGETKEVIK